GRLYVSPALSDCGRTPPDGDSGVPGNGEKSLRRLSPGGNKDRSQAITFLRLLRFGHTADDFKIVPAPGFSGGDEQAVNDVRLKRLRLRAGHGGFHAADGLAIGKNLHRLGIGVPDEMPAGQSVRVGLPFGEWD